MDQKHLSTPAPRSAPQPQRRLIAAGTITRRDGRTTTVRATPAGVTGTITPVRAQNDACPMCCNWKCTCPPWAGQTTAAGMGGQR